MASLPDATLLERWIYKQDAEAFSEIVSRHASMVYATCRRVLHDPSLAEDATQDCFIKLSQAERTIGASIGGWLHRVATNRCVDMLRSHQRRVTREEEYVSTHSNDDAQTWNDIQAHIDRAIAALPDDIRHPIVYHFLEGNTHKETAKILGITRSGTTRRIQRGIDLIRADLDKRGVTVAAAALTTLLGTHAVTAAPAKVEAALNKIALAGKGAKAGGTPLPTSRLTTAAIYAGGLALFIVAATLIINFASSEKLPSDTGVASSAPAPTNIAMATSDLDEDDADAAINFEADQDASFENQSEETIAVIESEPDSFRLQCLDKSGSPVEGAEVYFASITNRGRPMMFPVRESEFNVKQLGPYTSDSNGYVSRPPLGETIQFQKFHMAYARVPGKLVGAWNRPAKRGSKDTNVLTLIPSQRIEGMIEVPQRFRPEDVTVEIITMFIRIDGTLFGPEFSPSFRVVDSLWPGIFSVHPNAHGEFYFDDLPTDGRYYLAANGPGLGEAQQFTYDVKASNDPPIFEMMPEGVIEGTIRFVPSSRSAADVAVYARHQGGGKVRTGVTHQFIATTDNFGRYRIDGLPDGQFAVVAPPIGDKPDWVASVQVANVKTGFVTENIDFVMEHGAIVSGHVLVQGTKTGIPDAQLIALSPARVGGGQAIGSIVTDAAGRFEFRLPTGDSMIYFGVIGDDYVYPKDQGREVIHVAAGDSRISDLTFSLKAKAGDSKPPGQALVIGKVVDESGMPLSEVSVKEERDFMQGDDRRIYGYSRIGNTTEAGEFAATVTATGKHRFVIGGGVYSGFQTEWITLEPNQELDLGEIRLESYHAELWGSVLHEDGEPVSNAEIYLRIEGQAFALQQRTTDHEGRFHFKNVPEHAIKIGVSSRQYEHGFSFDVEANTDIEIVLPADKLRPDP